MQQFSIFIDETGSFSYLDSVKNCFVGGWVCRDRESHELTDKSLKDMLQTSVKNFNSGKTGKDQLIFPRDMHFNPLHTPLTQRNQNDTEITVSPEDIPPFFVDVFTRVAPVTELIFRSQGMPVVIPHEQAAYMEILRNTLIQLLKEKLFAKEPALRIVVAGRRTGVLLGYGGQKNPRAYEGYIAKKLTDELQKLSDLKDITVQFGSARKSPGLMLADFFCGAMKRSKYLGEMKDKIVKYPFSAGYRLIKLNIDEQLMYLREHNPVAALMQGIQIYTGLKTKDDLRGCMTAIRKIYAAMTPDEQEQFQNLIRNYLEDNLSRKETRYDFLDEAEIILSVLRELLPTSPDDMSPAELRLQTELGLNSLRIASHRGCCDNALVRNHLNFLYRYVGRSFSNRLEYIQHLVNSALMVSQLQDFNQLKFEDVENTIKPVRDLYQKVSSAAAAGGVHFLHDENSAKLEGTYAQMCGFIYDMTGKEEYYRLAEEGFLKDIDSCRAGDPAWEQGMGFLTALYWKKGDLPKTRDQFCKEIGKDPGADLFQLGTNNLYDSRRKSFFLLHHLYLCALAQKQGEQISGLNLLKEELLSNPRITKYPEMLSAKWLAVLFMKMDDFGEALELLQAPATISPTGSGFTIDFIRLPIKMLAHQCRLALEKQSSFKMMKEIDGLERQRENIKKLLDNLGLNKLGSVPAKWDPYEVAALPPFYYA